MDSLVERRVTDSGWLQVFKNPDRAGTAFLNFAVDGLAAHLTDLRSKGLTPETVENVIKGVQLSAITDPDGNTITFVGNFRINY